ncbi:MAG: chemotaxis protein CheX [Pseudomonadota bacterium]
MKTTLTQKVRDSIVEVMEAMFCFPVKEKKDRMRDFSALLHIQSLRACRIAFSGQYSGAIFLLIPQNILTIMTRNFLGDDTDQLSEKITDGTLKEALNMIAGNALTKLDEQSYTGLGIPEMISVSSLSMDEDSVVFDTKDGLIASFVEINH